MTKVSKELKRKGSRVPKVTKTIKVSDENSKRLWSLAGELQKEQGSKQSPDNAINCLFDCKEKLEKMIKEKKEKTSESKTPETTRLQV